MLVWTIFSLFKVNQERVDSLFMQCANSLTDGILLFYNEINYEKDNVEYLFKFCFICDLNF